MKDLDFDELDKAVNSLMSSVPKSAPITNPDEKENLVDIKPTLSPDDVSSSAKLTTATADAVKEASTTEEEKKDVIAATVATMPTATVPTPPAGNRRSGRFMDVVHPSSDMKKATATPRPISRQGVAVEPHSDSMLAPKPVKSTSTPADIKTPEKAESEKPIGEEALPSGEWPDPLEMTDFKDDVAPKEEWSMSESKPVEKETEPSPLTSPFLPDTKVEKRPLGSAAPAVSDETIALSESTEPHEDKTVDDPNDQLPALPGDVAPVLPEELQSDLMSVEADTHMGMPKTEMTHPSDEKSSEVSTLPHEPEVQPASAMPTGPVSIPQQYREEPSTGDQKNGGIYDTDSYHHPLDHPAKKKSGWMWVIWIVVILLAGAGAGAGLYFSGLIR